MAISRDYNAWVTRPRPTAQAQMRLFCFPYAGGGASLFRTWPEELPDLIEICAIQPPGRESRFAEPRFTRLPPLVEALGEALAPYLDKPFAFFGHSLGAITCFEVARWLRRQGLAQPAQLFVSAHRAPQLPDRHSAIHELPDAIFINEIGHLNGMPAEVVAEADLMELMMPLLRADFGLAETYTYTPEPPLPGAISAFGGVADEGISRDDLAAWVAQTTAHFVLRMLPGDHFFFLKQRALLFQAMLHDLHASGYL
jgi:medium-chain acyl-[acyl-carrier-protein] hydrolase